MGKINYFNNNILVVATTIKRLNLLRWYVDNSGTNKQVYLTSFKELHNNTLLTCGWYTKNTTNQVTLQII